MTETSNWIGSQTYVAHFSIMSLHKFYKLVFFSRWNIMSKPHYWHQTVLDKQWSTKGFKCIHPPRCVNPLCLGMFHFYSWRSELWLNPADSNQESFFPFISSQSGAWREHSRVWRWKLSLCFICISDPTDKSQMRPQRTPLNLPAELPHHCQSVSVMNSYFPLSTDNLLI